MRSICRYYQWCILFIAILNGLFLQGQKGGNVFYTLTTANELSSNRTTSVIQDRQGFYWIGTLDGLNRFDGTSCKVFQNVHQDSTSLSHNNCIFLLEDDKGDIWVATLMGLNRYKNNGKFERFFLSNPQENFERVNWIRGMTKDDAGNIWITSCGIWRYNIYTGQWKKWLHIPGDSTSVPAGIIIDPLYDKKKNGIWMLGSSGFIFLDLATEKIYHRKYNPKQILLLNEQDYGGHCVMDKNNNIWFSNDSHANTFSCYSTINNSINTVALSYRRGIFNMNTDDRNRLWINFWYGPSYIYDPFAHSLDSGFLDHYHPQSAISDNANNIYIDKTGNYWITSSNGISIYNPRAQFVKYYLLNDSRKNIEGGSLAITKITEQNDSIIWVGTSVGLYRYNLYKRKAKYIEELRNFIKRKYVRNLYFQNDSILWIAGWTNLIGYNVNRGKVIFENDSIDLPQCMTSDQQGNIWVGTWNNGLYKFAASGKLIKQFLPDTNSTKSVFSNHLVCFGNSSAEHKLWIGYNGGDGFSQINFQEQQFAHYKIKNNKNDLFATYAINCFREDEKKNLWIGTFGRGLISFNPTDGSFRTFTQSDGLKGNFINSILADDSSRLWISTTTGLNILDTKSGNIIRSDINLSFSGNDFVANGLIRKNKKLLFFAGTTIAEIDPASCYNTADTTEILLADFKVFDKEIPFPDSNDKAAVNLSYRQNFFSIEYSLLKSNPNSFTQYAYRLQGFEKDWNYVNERRAAYYTNVPPGEYKFLVKATDENGNWIFFSKPLSIIVKPPFWQQWWFIAAVVILITTGLFIFYRYRIDQLKKILAIRTRISQDLHDELGAALSSIHIYSSVAAKAMDKDSDKTKDALQQINENTRQVMENMSDIVWAISVDHGSETTLDAKLKNYGYELLTPLNINCVYRIDKEAEKKLVNMEARKNILLIVKEAINNIAKYSGATEASVRIEISGKDLELEITDNGNGISFGNKHTGYGIHSMKERTEAMQGTFQIQSGQNKGTVIHCSIPLTTISSN